MKTQDLAPLTFAAEAALSQLARIAQAHEQQAAALTAIAGALDRQARAVPDLTSEEARWLYHLAPTSVRRWPAEPAKVEDVRTRCAMLGERLGRNFADYALPEDERREKWAREKAEREAAAAANGHSEEPF